MNPVAFLQDLFAASTFPVFSAFLLGLLVALSPCPLSTNLTALAYIGRRTRYLGDVVTAGVLYTSGRVISYTLLTSFLLIVGVETSRVSWFLQDIGRYVLGPVLILAGILVLGLIPLPSLPGAGVRSAIAERLAGSGWAGAFALGALFALAFCPFSAALFFGALLPLALRSSGGIVLAPAFAVGTGLPVLLGAMLLTGGASQLGRLFNATSRLDPVLKRVAGGVFVLAGLYSIMSTLAG